MHNEFIERSLELKKMGLGVHDIICTIYRENTHYFTIIRDISESLEIAGVACLACPNVRNHLVKAGLYTPKPKKKKPEKQFVAGHNYTLDDPNHGRSNQLLQQLRLR